MRFNPAPGWPTPPADWTPPPGWQPDPSWPPAPEGWPFWIQGEQPTWVVTGKVVDHGTPQGFDLGAWIKRHPGLTVCGAVGGVIGFVIFSGLGASTSAVASGPYANDVDVEITDCWQGSDGDFHADTKYTNTSNTLLDVFVEIGFYDGEVQVQGTNDTVTLPAGRSAVADVSFFTDTGWAEELSCEVLTVSAYDN